MIIKNIRNNDLDLFENIKLLPRKARSSKASEWNSSSLVTYFRKGKVQKFFMFGNDPAAQELDFITAAETMESNVN